MKTHRLHSTLRKDLHQTARLLWLLAPPPDGKRVNLRIVRKLPADRLGDCSQTDKGYLIRLSADVVEQQPDAVWMLLAHEWAHALTWDNSVHNHGDAWGMALAKAWRVITHELGTGDTT
jgi:hypothetical protein